MIPSEFSNNAIPRHCKTTTRKLRTPTGVPIGSSAIHAHTSVEWGATPKHHDLLSFLAYAERSNLNKTSNVYKGTHYEYTVAAALESYNFILQRTGRSNDLGIDLVGHWMLPGSNGKVTEAFGSDIPVLIQCKFAKPTPSMIRELEGTYVGAPAGWNGPNVLALLVSTQQATEGVRAAVQRSKWPLGVVQVTRSGVTRGFLWNAVASEAGLQGLNTLQIRMPLME
ncbi:MAG: hypothetical protein FE78DRAFT_79794 [Acidomyces sp. 'richmondensis']|nr:MAG: hypothetical protein FE78DRAFT_79794 [Acidomyces sp. 'richmondensis']